MSTHRHNTMDEYGRGQNKRDLHDASGTAILEHYVWAEPCWGFPMDAVLRKATSSTAHHGIQLSGELCD